MLTLLCHFIIAIIATMAFGIIFDCPRREVILCGISGGIGWSVYEVLSFFGVNIVAATLSASIALTVFSRVFAVIRRQPAIVYLLGGIFPLVPGAGIYYTSLYLIQEDMEMFSKKGIETFEIAGAIAVGIIFAMAFPQSLLNKLGPLGKRIHDKQTMV